ncbi:MAG: hypothetical protein NUV97_02585 [archaeon]|nr:hypothetical protein [archaeon]MCR4323966.1 hypothetical protein [Nanoarchaeota archaeon]
MIHKEVLVFIDNDDSWNVQFNTICENLNKGLCSVYEKRPPICREYSPLECENLGKGKSYKFLWENVDEFEEWFKKSEYLKFV